MGDRLMAGIPPRCVTSHPGQFSLLPSVGQKNEYRPKCVDAVDSTDLNWMTNTKSLKTKH